MLLVSWPRVSRWLRRLDDDAAVIEQVSSRASEWLRMWEFWTFDLDKSFVGEVMNVVDINDDGLPEVLFLSSGYESIGIRAFEYGVDGPGETIVSYGAGC